MGILTQDFNHIEVTEELLLSDGYSKRRPYAQSSAYDMMYSQSPCGIWHPSSENVFVKKIRHFLGADMYVTYDADRKSMILTSNKYNPINNKSDGYINITKTKISDWGDLKKYETRLIKLFGYHI